MAEHQHERGALRRALEPWPRGQVLTTDPACAANPPAGPAPCFVDPDRFAHLAAADLLDVSTSASAAAGGTEKRPDAAAGGPGVTITIKADPRPVPLDDPRVARGGA